MNVVIDGMLDGMGLSGLSCEIGWVATTQMRSVIPESLWNAEYRNTLPGYGGGPVVREKGGFVHGKWLRWGERPSVLFRRVGPLFDWRSV